MSSAEQQQKGPSAPAIDHRLLFESLPSLYMILLPDAPRFTIATVSDAYAAATLVQRDQVVGRGLFEVFPDNPNDPAADGVRNLRASLERVIATRKLDTMALQKYDVARPDGSGFEEKYWSPVNVPAFDGDRLCFIMHRVEDATESVKLKRSEEQSVQRLRESESRFRSLADNTPGIVMRCRATAGWPMLYMSEATEDVTGYSVEEFVEGGLLFGDIMLQEDIPAIQRSLEEQLARGRDVRVEYRIRRKDGVIRWLQGNVRLITLREGGDGFEGVVLDITDTKQLEAALIEAREAAEAATRAKAAFLSSMSHEIRTPMNAVIGMTSILGDTELSAEQKDAVEVIRSSGEHLLTVINDILDYSKIEAGKLELEQAPFSLRECIESAMDLLGATAQSKGVEIGYLMLPDTPEGLSGDVGRLRQVLVNLLSNAVKFTPGRGQVMVEARLLGNRGDEREVEIAVKDSGIGMDEETQKRLFQAFMQADASTTRAYGGTGLGLSISRRLVEMMGGQIGVQSVAGKGSTFRFSFRARAAALSQRSRALDAIPEFKGRRVLVVDDIDINRRILCHYAELWGMVPHQTAAPEEALEWIRRGDPFDLALLDYHMPGALDGLQLAAELRKLRDERSLPILMLSSVSLSSPTPGVITQSLLKPIKPSRLFDVISRTLLDSGHANKPETAGFQIPRQLGEEHPLRVLVAEDNPVNRKVAQLLLQRMGYQPDFAADGAEAVAAVRRQVYDVVFMDVQMPVLDGLEATREICRMLPPDKRPRIVGLSANVMEDERKTGALAGMDGYLPKPAPPELLAQALRNTPRRQAEAQETVGDLSAEAIAQLRKTYGDDGAKEIVDALHVELPRQRAQLQDALAQDDRIALKRLAHTIKSCSLMVGATALASQCELQERTAAEGGADGVAMRELLGRFERLVEGARLAVGAG